MNSKAAFLLAGTALGCLVGWVASPSSSAPAPTQLESSVAQVQRELVFLRQALTDQSDALRHLADTQPSEPAPLEHGPAVASGDWPKLIQELQSLVDRLEPGDVTPSPRALEKDTAALQELIGPGTDAAAASRHATEQLFGASPSVAAPRLGAPDQIIEDGAATRWVYIMEGTDPLRLVTCTFIDGIAQRVNVEIVK